MTTYTPGAIWLLIAVIGIGTLLIRLSFLALLGRVATVPPLVARVLRLIPAAVLAALVVPGVTRATGEFDLMTARFLAAVIAAAVAWKTRNVFATIGVGMGVLWVAQAVG
jgi:branched-subunit amino acid transport protein